MRTFDPVQLGSIEQFCKAAELSSFTKAAEQLGLTPASVSRAISRLEDRLGVKLFNRSTRHVRLTNEGQLYWQQCQQALDQIAAAELALTGQQETPKGPLRISVGSIYANYRLLPLLPRFSELHPQISLEISISNRIVDFVEEDCDLAIRLGMLPDSTLIAQKLEDATIGIFATPEYLHRKGIPGHLDDLEDHDCIQFILPSTGRPMAWNFIDKNDKDLDITVHRPHLVYEDAQGCVSWCMAGGGLAQIYHFIANTQIENGTLVEVLKNHAGRTRPFWIIYPQNRHLSSKVRVFVEYLKKSIQEKHQ